MECPQCGKRIEQGPKDSFGVESITCLFALQWLADLAERDAIGATLILLRIANPKGSFEEIGKRAGVSKMWVSKVFAQLSQTYPTLAPMLGQHSRRSKAQQERRQKEKTRRRQIHQSQRATRRARRTPGWKPPTENERKKQP